VTLGFAIFHFGENLILKKIPWGNCWKKNWVDV
jgi:hypothetical protein